jgi:carbamoyltransferase
LAGGVALNCVANGRLLREGPFEQIWIQPSAGDAGCALGAALDVYHTYFKKPRTVGARSAQGGSYLGPGFSQDEVRAYLDTHGYPYQEISSTQRAAEIARLLNAGKVVGHFSGRMEFGPRALGSRSILGDPRNQEMQATLNLKIKYRESFRPFAPTVLAERVSEYFELDRESPYMLLVAPVKQKRCLPFKREPGTDLTKVVRQVRSDIPAVTHIDYSARIQTIQRDDHHAYYDLIAAFEKATGYGVIVNTSFNVRGEPIICTPHDAYRCFMRTEMDVLVLENFILLKEQQPLWPEEKGHVEKNEDIADEVVVEESPFVQALTRVYQEQFLPVAEALRADGQARFDTAFQRRATMWEDTPAAGLDKIFGIPPQWDAAEADPAQIAAAVAEFWKPGAASEQLQPILQRLLEVAREFPEAEFKEEQVSDSVYVMY